jgi:hypothetical protein
MMCDTVAGGEEQRYEMARIRALGQAGIVAAAVALVPLALVSPAGAAATKAAPSQSTVAQPVPPVRASAFRFEPKGEAPVRNNGRIPNPATPTGSPISPPSFCSVTFIAGHGGSAATVNSWIATHENSIRRRTAVCLSGVFTEPLHIWSKTTAALLEVAPAPDETATFDLGTVRASGTNRNQYWSDSGGISIVDSRSVEIYGLTVENYTYDGTAQTPAGIYVTTRSDTQNKKQGTFPHLSACFLHHGSCGDIFIIDNTVAEITNRADENHTSRALCDNANVDAYGIAVIAAGNATSQRLQHVVVEDNTVTGTRTGQSETITLNGALKDFLVAGNVVDDVDNIGIDTIGWETGDAQASHGYVAGNTVYNVDTWSNAAYGKWDSTTKTCDPLPENAAGLYDDGGSYIWFASNTVWNTDQGINLDVETPGKETDHLLVSGNVVHDDPGTAASDPSSGQNPPGTGGTSTVAGHDPYAMYIDAFGARATISDVYVYDNVFQNESQHFLNRSDGMPVVDLGGAWSNVEIWHNTIGGLGRADRYNPLLEVDRLPKAGSTDPIDCNDYENLSIAGNTVNGNFASPSASYLSLASWQKGNKEGWDAHSEVDGFSPSCPSTSIP